MADRRLRLTVSANIAVGEHWKPQSAPLPRDEDTSNPKTAYPVAHVVYSDSFGFSFGSSSSESIVRPKPG